MALKVKSFRIAKLGPTGLASVPNSDPVGLFAVVELKFRPGPGALHA